MIPQIGGLLESATEKIAKQVEKIDYKRIQSQLEVLSNCGDPMEQCDIARRVARQVTDRYKDQLIRIDNSNATISTGCSSCCKKTNNRTPLDELVLFAVSYIVSTVVKKEMPEKNGNNNKDWLVDALVDLVSNASEPETCMPKCCSAGKNIILPLSSKPNVKQPSAEGQEHLLQQSNEVNNFLIGYALMMTLVLFSLVQNCYI